MKPIFHIQKWRYTHRNKSNRLDQCLDTIIYTHNNHNCIFLSRNINSKIGHFSGFPLDERVRAIRRIIQCTEITGSPTNSDTIRSFLNKFLDHIEEEKISNCKQQIQYLLSYYRLSGTPYYYVIVALTSTISEKDIKGYISPNYFDWPSTVVMIFPR